MKTFPIALKTGYDRFRSGKLEAERARYELLALEGQNPDVLVISCCDSRVTPAAIFDTGPGELFVIRNVANLVPQFSPNGDYHGTSAAVEYAVLGLKVGHIVVMGHGRCGGIRAYVEGVEDLGEGTDFIGHWMSIVAPAAKGLEHLPPAEQCAQLERRAVVHTLQNLRSFPIIKAREDAGKLSLHGAFFDVHSGVLEVYDKETKEFLPCQ
jgi:carbonic anhydrase